MKRKFNITIALALVSILGFLTIISQEIFNYELNSWTNGLMFIIIGSGIVLIGSFWTAIEWQNGIDEREAANILFTIVGISSVIVGFIELPIELTSSIDIPALGGIKAIIAIFAIIFISLQTFFVKRR